jgi:hypothetical protein
VNRDLAFLFAFDAPAEESAEEMGRLVAQLNEDRLWSGGPIRFVNEIDASSASQPEDVPIHTVGGTLQLRRQDDSPPSIEAAQLAEVELLMERLRAFTRSAGSVVIQYDGEEIGGIENGEMDRSLSVGLLDEWRARVHG